ncbi:hypothetical protein BX666DRAFT_1882631 [Dichotomocladium elegans]|nr:hypothetical protein BX666DRAFT_1882631 [Dichotomocladium elegans]
MARLMIDTLDTSSNRPLVFCYYVSGHGWGHATRANQIIADILALPAKHKVYVVSNASDFIFQGVIQLGAKYRQADIDAGVVQPLAYTVDRLQTITNLRLFLQRRQETLDAEIAWLKDVRADCVVCDAPFLPCAAAAGAGIPAAIASNFTFDEVYLGLCEHDELDEEIKKLVERTIFDYRNADLLIRLPGAIRIPSFEETELLVPRTPVTGSFPRKKGVVNGRVQLPYTTDSNVHSSGTSVFERRIIDVPLVFRKYRRERIEVLAELGIPPEVYNKNKILLLSFGGQALGKGGWVNPLPPGWICIVCCAPDGVTLPPNFYRASRDAYVPDLTNAADVVLGKLGYGTCSECIGHGTPFVYVPRPQFIEELGLKKLMMDQGSAVELAQVDFEAGLWSEAIQKASTLPGRCNEPERLVAHNGGPIAARMLENFVAEWRLVASHRQRDESNKPQ